MNNLISNSKPASYNSCSGQKKIKYRQHLTQLYNSFNPMSIPSNLKMYGIVYHFYNGKCRMDADNLSKPVWDALNHVAYNDDNQIKYRVSASIKKDDIGFTMFDFKDLNAKIIFDLVKAIVNEPHFFYVECGDYDDTLLKVNLEK